MRAPSSIVVAAVLLAPCVALAQEASVTGVVLDTLREALPGVLVFVDDGELGTRRPTPSASSGLVPSRAPRTASTTARLQGRSDFAPAGRIQLAEPVRMARLHGRDLRGANHRWHR